MKCSKCDEKVFFASDLFTAALLIHHDLKVTRILRDENGVSLGFLDNDELWEVYERGHIDPKFRVRPLKFWESVMVAQDLMEL